MGIRKLTNSRGKFIINNPDGARIGNDVAGVNWNATKIIIGIVVGLLLPFIVDWFLFGTFTPCKTITAYEDGSSVQACEVRR